jgi:phage recombination protein Bet
MLIMATQKKEVATIPEQKKISILAKMGAKFSVDGSVLQKTLSDTVFKGASAEQTVALLIVADQYGLNPFTKEIYAFPAKGGGIVPVVGIDGWLRIINENPQFDGMETITDQDEESCTCIIYRKDRSHPIEITEYLSECKRNTDPWNVSPKRMLRHKAIIQCARIAFGYSGVHDEDEAKTIRDAEFTDITRKPVSMPVEIPEAHKWEPSEAAKEITRGMVACGDIIALKAYIQTKELIIKSLDKEDQDFIKSQSVDCEKMLS